MRVLAAAFLALFTILPANAQVPRGELPETARPTAYRLDLTVDPTQPRFRGHAEIDIELKEAASTLYLHGRDLAVTRAEARTGRMAPNMIAYKQVDPTGVAVLAFARPLRPGRHTLVFDYDAPFTTAAEGLFRVEVAGKWYAWSQLEAIDARRVFPGFDEPRHKTPYTVSMTVPAAIKAFGNGPETAATPATGGMVKHQFKATQPLPTYLLAFAAGDFDVVSRTIPANAVRKTPLDFRAIATRGQGQRLQFTADESPKILALLERYFGTPYPFDKLDVIANPIHGGAMENAGLVVFDDTLLLLDKDAPPRQLKAFGVVMAHELAHQWFGDLVTPRWWDDIWLNESFAEWMGNRVAAEWQPDLGIGADQLDGALVAMDADSRPANRPIRQAITANSDINSAFDSITYRKGGQVIRMFESVVGPERFQRGVRLHLDRYRFGTADADQFFQSIADGSGDADIAPAWRSFVEQDGVPLITFTAAGGGSYKLAQQRYQPIGVTLDGKRQWIVPVCARSGEGRQCALMDGASAALKVVGTAPWVSGNADGAGYYRYDLPAADWDRLIAAAPTLPAPDALTAADSLWSTYAAGRGGFDRVLRGGGQFAKHDGRLVAVLIPYNLAALQGGVLGEDSDRAVAAMMRRWFGSRVGALGLDPRRGAYASDAPERAQLRVTLASMLAVEGRDPAARKTLAQAAQAFVGGDAAALDPAFRPTAFNVAVRDGGRPFRDALYNRFIGSDDPLLRRHASAALGQVDTADAARETLARLSDKRLQNLEFQGMMAALSRQPATRGPLLDWLDANYATFKARTGGLLGRVLAIGGQYCSEAEAARFEAFFRPKLGDLGISPLDLDRPLAEARQCIAFRAAKGAEIAAALKTAAAAR